MDLVALSLFCIPTLSHLSYFISYVDGVGSFDSDLTKVSI